MTENEIKLLGFEKQEEPNGGTPFYYYTYTIARGFEFISCSNDEACEGEWYVEFFDSDPTIRFIQFSEVQRLINLLEKRLFKN